MPKVLVLKVQMTSRDVIIVGVLGLLVDISAPRQITPPPPRFPNSPQTPSQPLGPSRPGDPPPPPGFSIKNRSPAPLANRTPLSFPRARAEKN